MRPIEARVGAHQVTAAGIGSDYVIPRNQRIADTSFSTSLPSRLSRQTVDDIETRLGNQTKIR